MWFASWDVGDVGLLALAFGVVKLMGGACYLAKCGVVSGELFVNCLLGHGH